MICEGSAGLVQAISNLQDEVLEFLAEARCALLVRFLGKLADTTGAAGTLRAARVAAARWMIDGATFIDCFRELEGTHGFGARTAFVVTMRTYRAGGLTKDAVYLRGLGQILNYLSTGGTLEPLFIGKIAVNHIPIVNELRWRGVLREPPLKPRYMSDPGALERLQRGRRSLQRPVRTLGLQHDPCQPLPFSIPG